MINLSKQLGLTLLEIIVVVIIIGVVASLAIPSFMTQIQRGLANDAQNNLLSIYVAQKNRYGQGGTYYGVTTNCNGTTVNDDAGLNTALSTSIIKNNINYCCYSASGTDFTCYAKTTSGSFTMTLQNSPPVLSGGFNTTGRNPICVGCPN